MPDYTDLRRQAIRLRQEGYSTTQIGNRLGVSGVTVWRWVRDMRFAGFNDESLAKQLETRRDPALYERAIELRKQGYSYNLISQELGVNKSTLSGWLKDIAFAEHHPHVRERIDCASHAMTEARIEKARQSRYEAQQEATAEISHFLSDDFTDRELFIAGLMLYWGEGVKAGDYVAMTNSDPAIMQIFLSWIVRFISVTAENFRAEVHIYPDINIEEAEAYWSGISNIPRTQFYKAQTDKSTDKMSHKQGKLPFGAFHVKVMGVRGKYRLIKVLQWIEMFRQYLPYYMRV